MKKIIILSTLILGLCNSPLAANEVKMAVDQATDKLQKEQIDVHLEKYGVRHITENGSQKAVGLYKIIIGDPQKLQNAMSLNKSHGFDGWIFTKYQNKKDDWQKIRVHRPVRQKKGWKKSRIVNKDMLPYPFNTMAHYLLNKIHFFNVYPDNDDVAVIYIIEGTEFSDCQKIFDYICKKKKLPTVSQNFLPFPPENNDRLIFHAQQGRTALTQPVSGQTQVKYVHSH